MAMKPIGKSIVSSDYDDKVMFFKDVSLVHHKSQLRFRLIHFWEAWNPVKNTLIGLEMLLIDEQYLPEMKRGSVYKLNNFYGSRNKSVFRVSDRTATVSFSWNSELSVLQGCHTPFDEDSFRFHSYEEFQAKCDLKGDLYDVVGHMKLVNGQSIIETPVLDEVEIAKARRVLVHVQSHEYRSKISVYDNSEQAFLYYLVDAGSELTGKPASELVRNYFESNADQEGNHEAPVPEDLISTIGQRHKFCVKVTELNLSGKTRSLTVTKNLPLDIPPATKSLEGNHTTATSEETFKNSGFCRGE
uniref:Replication factor A C-terminal domain-containing protein n=1 Tax=Brassica campestris TaxID=3711 RepID=M4F7C3_BRACM